MLVVILFIKIAKRYCLSLTLMFVCVFHLHQRFLGFIHKYSAPSVSGEDEFKKLKCTHMLGCVSELYLNDLGFLKPSNSELEIREQSSH